MDLPLAWQRFLDAARQRVRVDFRVGVYLVFGVLAFIVLLPIAVVRLLQGRVVLAALEAVVIVAIFGMLRHAWRGGDLDRLGIAATVLITSAGCAIAALSPIGLFWLFPIVMAGAFLAPTWLSLPTCLGVMAFLWWQGETLKALGEPLAVLAAMGVNGVFAAIFAHHAGERRAHLEQLATRDALTGAENRRAMDEALAIALQAVRRGGRTPALVILDLDHFKAINDRFGHEAGDRVLRDFTRIVQESTRASDRLFRFGGEEFVLLIEHADARAVEGAFARLQAALRDGLVLGDGTVTVSGGAALPVAGDKVDGWLGRADAALYEAKAAGRDRLVVAPPP
ncbi:MAG: diguanylate cyclase [Lysobacteraceae bacterium]